MRPVGRAQRKVGRVREVRTSIGGCSVPDACLRQHGWREQAGDKCPNDNGRPWRRAQHPRIGYRMRAMVCGIGGKSLRPKSFAFTVADKGAAIFVANGAQQVIARDLNPAIPGPAFASAKHKPTNYVLSKNEHIIVGGTHVACAALPIDNQTLETFGCGAFDTATGTAGYYVAGTYAVTISEQYIGILKVGKMGAQTVVAKEKQP
jgi:hypothetical protein